MKKPFCDKCDKEIIFPEDVPFDLNGDRYVDKTGNRWGVFVRIRLYEPVYEKRPDLCLPCLNEILFFAFQQHMDYVKERRAAKTPYSSIPEM